MWVVVVVVVVETAGCMLSLDSSHPTILGAILVDQLLHRSLAIISIHSQRIVLMPVLAVLHNIVVSQYLFRNI